MSLKAGRLRHRVTIQEPSYIQDPDTGAMTPGWVDVWVNVPAAIEPLSVREFLSAQSFQSKVSARITLRHREGLTADMRIVHREKIYNPAGYLADPVSGLEYITIPVSEGINDG